MKRVWKKANFAPSFECFLGKNESPVKKKTKARIICPICGFTEKFLFDDYTEELWCIEDSGYIACEKCYTPPWLDPHRTGAAKGYRQGAEQRP